MLLKTCAVLSFLGLAHASVDGEKFSEDGNEENHNFGVSFFQDSGRPEVVFFSNRDNAGSIYCLEFRGLDESDNWSVTDKNFISEQDIDFEDVDWGYEENPNPLDTTWTRRIYAPAATATQVSDNLDSIEFKFRTESAILAGETVESYGFKFDVVMDGYTWYTADGGDAMDHNVLLSLRMKDCSDKYSGEDVDSSESGEGDGDDEDATPIPARRRFLGKMPVDVVLRRRLSGSESSDTTGVSSDDSHEFDLSSAFFTVARNATDCDDNDISVDLEYEAADNDLYLVFDYFGDCVNLDPTVGVDEDKLGAAMAYGSFIAVALSAIVAMFA